jgi:excisionase family DNA binding protein
MQVKNMEINTTSTSEVCTTQEAARLLGISVTSVQQLVEAGIIEAWKTKGGHRRIPLAAVHAYKASPGGTVERKIATAPARTSILVIEDNEMQRGIYEKQISSWNLNVDLTFCENGYQALVEIASKKPDVVLADIMMSGIDGYEVINTILGYPELADINIAILSRLSEAELNPRGGVPAGVVFFGKPINFDELRGYLRACCAQHVRRNRS